MASSMRRTPLPVISAGRSGWGDETDGAQVVDLVGLHLLQGGNERGEILEITSEQLKLGNLFLDHRRFRVRLPPEQAIDLVALTDEELGQVATILARDARYQCPFHCRLPEVTNEASEGVAGIRVLGRGQRRPRAR